MPETPIPEGARDPIEDMQEIAEGVFAPGAAGNPAGPGTPETGNPGPKRPGLFRRGLNRLSRHGTPGEVRITPEDTQPQPEPFSEATDEQRNDYIGVARNRYGDIRTILGDKRTELHPPETDQPPVPISLTEIAQSTYPGTDPESLAKVEEGVNGTRQNLADLLFKARYSPEEVQNELQDFSPEDQTAIRELLLNTINDIASTKTLMTMEDPDGNLVTLSSDPDWLKTWEPELQKPNSPGILNRIGTGFARLSHRGERKPAGEAADQEVVTDQVEQAVQEKRFFGRKVISFMVEKGAIGGGRFVARQIVRNLVSWSGLAGAVGGGVAGTMVAGGIVGGIVGGLVEYVRQVNKNLNVRELEEHPELAARKRRLLRKVKELKYLKHRESWGPNDYRKLGKAIIVGAFMGAGAGAVVEYVPGIREFLGDLLGKTPGVEVIKNTAGEVAGATGRTIGETSKGLGDLARNRVPGAEWVGDRLGDVGKAIGLGDGGPKGPVGGEPLPGGPEPQGPEPIAGEPGEGSPPPLPGGVELPPPGGAEPPAPGGAEPTPPGGQPGGQEVPAPKTEVEALKEQLQAQSQQMADMQRQMAELRQALVEAQQQPAGKVPGFVEPGAGAPPVPGAADSIPPTEIHGHTVAGSVGEQTLTYDGKPWVLLDNGTKNINFLFESSGESGTVDKQALARHLQQATKLWVNGQLSPSANADLYNVFHLSNGTSSVYKDLLNKDTLLSLRNLGIVSK